MTLDSTLDRNEKTAAQRAGLALSDEDIFSLLGTLADGIIVMDAGGVVRFFSDEAARMFGYTSQEIVGQKLNRLMFDEDVPLHDAGLARRRHGGTARRGLVRVRGRRKDGFETPLEISIGQATVRGQTIFLGSLRDISQRKHTKEALVASEEKFRKVFWSSLDSMALTRESDGLILDFNEQFLAMNGFAANDVRGKTAAQLGIWSDPEKRESFRQELRKKGGTRSEVPYQLPDGSIGTVFATSQQLEVDGVACILSIARDITVRKTVEEALRQSEDKFARVFHASPGSLVITHAKDGRIIDYNEAFLTINGFSEGNVRGKTTVELGFWTGPRERDVLANATRERGGLTDFEIGFKRPDGSVGTMLASTRLIQVEGIECILFIGRDITDRKLAEDALRTSEQSLRDAQRIARVGNWEFDVEAQKFTFSAEIARITEAPPGQTESSWDEFIRNVHRDHRYKFEKLVTEAVNAGDSFDFEYDLYLKGGRRKTIRTRGEVETGDSGAILLRGTNHDVTAQKRAEEALRQSEEKFSKVFKVSPDLILITRAGTGVVVDANDKLFPMTGYHKEEVLGQPMANWVHPEDQAEIGRQIKESGECAEYETRFMHRDGRTFVGLVSARTIQVEGEDCILSVTRDITERKRAEEELRQSRELLEAVVDGAPVGISTKDQRHRYTFMNRHLADVFGTTPEEAIGKTTSELMSPEYGALVAGHDRQVFESGLPLAYFEDESVDAGGTKRSWLTTKLPLRGNEQDGSQVLSISLDITERKLAEAGLRHASKLEAVGQLTGGIAHDFNNLLTALIGNLQFLGDQIGDDADARRYLNVSLAAAVRGADLTQRLLAFSRKQVLKPKSTDINALVKGMTELLNRTLGTPIKITATLADDLSPAMVDANQLESAIVNLAINARDAMPDGGELTIETALATLEKGFAASEEDFVPGPYVSLAVSDTGRGMPPEVLEHAFEPFFTTKEVGRGSGLGLSTIFGFIKQTGGQTAVSSELGAGTTVTLYLPLAAHAAARASAKDAKEEAVPTGTEMILVVEDDHAVQAFAAAVLTHLGYHVEVAADGRQAIELLPTIATPDLLLTDMVLPGGMDGLKTAQEVVRRCPGTRVLIVSGHTNRDFLRSGGEDLEFMPKPYTRDALAARVRKILDA